MHMQIYCYCISIFFYAFFKIFHHLMSDPKSAIGLKHTNCKNVCMFFSFVVLDTYSVGSYYYIVVKAEFGELCVFISNFLVKWSTVFYWKHFKIKFSKHVYILRIDIPISYFKTLLLAHKIDHQEC